MEIPEDYVLIIDDDDDMHAMISDVLQRFDVRVCSVRGGLDGLFYIRQSVPRLIILDLCMPHLTGWDLVKQVRNNPAAADVPIVVLTSFPVDTRLAASLRLPPENIVRKSHILTELPAAVGKIVA